MALLITCKCGAEGKIKMVENRGPKDRIGPVTIWFYKDPIAEYDLDATRVEAGPLRDVCPKCAKTPGFLP